MKTHAIREAEKSENSVTKKKKNSPCKCVRTIFIGFWFGIHLHYRNQYSKIDFFQQFLQIHYVFVSLINMALCKQADEGGGNEKGVIGTF